MGKQGPCRHCGVTSELLFLDEAEFFIFVPFLFSCFLTNYASGKQTLAERLHETGIRLSVFLVRSLVTEFIELPRVFMTILWTWLWFQRPLPV
jgi:hypothetical protein